MPVPACRASGMLNVGASEPISLPYGTAAPPDPQSWVLVPPGDRVASQRPPPWELENHNHTHIHTHTHTLGMHYIAQRGYLGFIGFLFFVLK